MLTKRFTIALRTAALLTLVALLACGSSDQGAAPADAGGDAAQGPSGPPKATFSGTAVEFGQIGCGKKAADKKVTINNNGGEVLTWTASLQPPGPFQIVGAAGGKIPPGGTGEVTIAASPIDPAAKPGAILTASLSITTNDPDLNAFFIPVSMAASGVSLELTPLVADFGTFPVNVQAPDLPLKLVNKGSSDATITITQPANKDFAVWYAASQDAGPISVTIPPGGSIPGLRARFKPTSTTLETGTADVAVAEGVCGTAVDVIKMSGQGTAGVVGVSPGTLDFGLVNCGTTSTALQFTMINTGNTLFTYTAALGKGSSSPYAISATGGVILPSNSQVITVTPKGIPSTSAVTPNLYGDVITLTTDIAGDTPRTVVLKETAQGAILALSAATLSFGKQDVGIASAPLSLDITNTGNAPAQVRYVLAGGAASSYAAAPSAATTVAAGATVSGTVTFLPNAFTTVTDKVSLVTSDVTCQPVPSAVPADGAGHGVASKVSVGGHSRRRNGRSSACALLGGGRVACWGNNFYGQLGDGTTTAALTPVLVKTSATAVLTDATAITSGDLFHCAIRPGGAIWCWGARPPINDQSDTSATFATPTGVVDAVAVDAGHRHWCYLTEIAAGNNQVTCKGGGGRNDRGQLLGTGIQNSVGIAVSGSGGCSLQSNKTVQCWGFNQRGEIGNGSTGGNTGPTTVSGLSDAIGIGGGGGGARSSVHCAIRQAGTVSCWGNTRHGRGGNGNGNDSSTPQPANVLANVTQLAMGSQHGCALSGTDVYCWGNNSGGALGGGSDGANPTKVALPANAIYIASGGQGSCAILTGGVVQCWGAIGNGVVPGF